LAVLPSFPLALVGTGSRLRAAETTALILDLALCAESFLGAGPPLVVVVAGLDPAVATSLSIPGTAGALAFAVSPGAGGQADLTASVTACLGGTDSAHAFVGASTPRAVCTGSVTAISTRFCLAVLTLPLAYTVPPGTVTCAGLCAALVAGLDCAYFTLFELVIGTGFVAVWDGIELTARVRVTTVVCAELVVRAIERRSFTPPLLTNVRSGAFVAIRAGGARHGELHTLSCGGVTGGLRTRCSGLGTTHNRCCIHMARAFHADQDTIADISVVKHSAVGVGIACTLASHIPFTDALIARIGDGAGGCVVAGLPVQCDGFASRGLVTNGGGTGVLALGALQGGSCALSVEASVFHCAQVPIRTRPTVGTWVFLAFARVWDTKCAYAWIARCAKGDALSISFTIARGVGTGVATCTLVALVQTVAVLVLCARRTDVVGDRADSFLTHSGRCAGVVGIARCGVGRVLTLLILVAAVVCAWVAIVTGQEDFGYTHTVRTDADHTVVGYATRCSIRQQFGLALVCG